MQKRSNRQFTTLAAGVLQLSACPAAQLETAFSPSGPGSALPNGGVSEAAAKAGGVQLGQVVQGRIGSVGERDEFRFDGVEGQEMIIYLQGTGGPDRGGMVQLHLVNSTGNADLASVYSPHSSVKLGAEHTEPLKLPETGTYTIRVSSAHPSNPHLGSYRFQVREIR